MEAGPVHRPDHVGSIGHGDIRLFWVGGMTGVLMGRAARRLQLPKSRYDRHFHKCHLGALCRA